MRNLLETLKREFDAEDDSFLIKLRCDFYWDKNAFERLTNAMKGYCEKNQENKLLERWIAEGFWFISHFVKDYSSHPHFPKPYTPEYYEKAYERLDDLAYWFFFGQSPYIGGKGFESLEPLPESLNLIESNFEETK
ncbi:MAG: hypothetical protein H7Z37_13270 [Pyrinomonadaceae bacterium]|nr:hypothetical protein [Pyrinomonadaceae bacterium]